MSNEQWVTLVENVLRTLGEVRSSDVASAEFKVKAHALAALGDDNEPLKPNDGRPKIYTFTVTTSA